MDDPAEHEEQAPVANPQEHAMPKEQEALAPAPSPGGAEPMPRIESATETEAKAAKAAKAAKEAKVATAATAATEATAATAATEATEATEATAEAAAATVKDAPLETSTAHGFVMDPSQGSVDTNADPEVPVTEANAEATQVAPEPPKKRRIWGLMSWMERRAQSAISKVYQTQADDLEERAKRVVGSAYREHSDDLEERAVRVLRSAIADEADRIKEAISHGVAVKKIEVRLSLLVLVIASLIYLGLFWFTQGGGSTAGQ